MGTQAAVPSALNRHTTGCPSQKILAHPICPPGRGTSAFRGSASATRRLRQTCEALRLPLWRAWPDGIPAGSFVWSRSRRLPRRSLGEGGSALMPTTGWQRAVLGIVNVLSVLRQQPNRAKNTGRTTPPHLTNPKPNLDGPLQSPSPQGLGDERNTSMGGPNPTSSIAPKQPSWRSLGVLQGSVCWRGPCHP